MSESEEPEKLAAGTLISHLLELRSRLIRAMVAIGTSKAAPKPKKILSTKSRYELMSTIGFTPVGAVLTKNWNITGNTNW